MNNSYRDAFTGSTFDDFLLEEGLHEEVESAAIQRVIAWKDEHTPLSKSRDDICAPSREKNRHVVHLINIAKKV
jgi:hypothetical protein